MKGAIPPGTIGVLLGRRSLTIKGTTVHLGIIDSDYEGELIIVVTVSKIWAFKKGERIAQFLFLPFVMPSFSSHLRIGGFDSTTPLGASTGSV